jgi:hypothetical protein
VTEETTIALRNYDWLIRNHRDVSIDWETGTPIYGDGGAVLGELGVPGFTPAT